MGIYKFDIVILGGGPAGISAGIYAARSNASTAIIDISMLGGQPSNYLELENYPAFPIIGGYDLMEKFEEHADKFGVQKFPMQEIKNINLVSNPKIIETHEATFEAKSVIIASGAQAKKLGVKGELEYIGRGVSYCAVCDGAFYKDKIVTVVGGGNAAVEEAMYLTKFAEKVYIVHRRDTLRADKIIQERAFANPKIEFIWDSKVNEIQGDNLVTTAVIENIKTGEITNLKTDGVFPYIGFTPNVEGFTGQLQQDANGFILTDSTMQTSIEGVFAAGDVRNTPLRQVITATSDGAISAVYASKYIEKLETSKNLIV
ncbi:MAG: thioredoxin-disulfide reductase [Candidatus Gastranaerophilaceae bacterium]